MINHGFMNDLNRFYNFNWKLKEPRFEKLTLFCFFRFAKRLLLVNIPVFTDSKLSVGLIFEWLVD